MANATFFSIPRDIAAGGSLADYTSLVTPDSTEHVRVYGFLAQSKGDFTLQYEDDDGTTYGNTLYFSGENKLHLPPLNFFTAPQDKSVGFRCAAICPVYGIIFWDSV